MRRLWYILAIPLAYLGWFIFPWYIGKVFFRWSLNMCEWTEPKPSERVDHR